MSVDPDNPFVQWYFSPAEKRRVDHEWSKWSGSEEDGIRINDAQCERIDRMKAKLNTPGGLFDKGPWA